MNPMSTTNRTEQNRKKQALLGTWSSTTQNASVIDVLCVVELHTHLVHVGVDEDLEGPHGQGDVGGGGGDGEDVVEGLLAHVVGVDCLDQVAAGDRYHGGVHGEV